MLYGTEFTALEAQVMQSLFSIAENQSVLCAVDTGLCYPQPCPWHVLNLGVAKGLRGHLNSCLPQLDMELLKDLYAAFFPLSPSFLGEMLLKHLETW